MGIVGGGAAGTYLAYKLAPLYRERLCLFEKESQLGGRMSDAAFESTNTNQTVWIGTGARRVNHAQEPILKLGKELGISFETPEMRSQLIWNQFGYGHSPDDFIKFFPKLKGPLDRDKSTNREDELYALLLKHKDKASLYPNLSAYIEDIAGKDAKSFLHAVGRFHGDFDYDISASNYLDYLQAELNTSGTNHYPIGGMSQFVKQMELQIRKRGARIYLSEPVLEFHSINSKEGYRVESKNYTSKISRLVFATPPSGFDIIKGELASLIQASPEYQSLLAIPVVVINQQWTEPWWEKIPPAKNVKGSNAKIWRAWSNQQCVNHTEIPQESYAKSAHAIRAVYTDDKKCVDYWQNVMKTQGITAVENLVIQGLQSLFNHKAGVSKLQIPKAIKTTYHFWPAGWYYVRAGAKFSNSDIAQWSQEPLKGKKNLMFVGEAYWPNRPGWSEGAYLSANALVQTNFSH